MICKGRHGCMEGSQALPGTKHLPSLNIWVMLSPPNWVQPHWLVRVARPSRLGEYWPRGFYKQRIGSRGLALNIVEEQKTCGFLAHSLQLIKEQWWGQKWFSHPDENIWRKFLLTFKNGLQHHTTEILLFVSYSWIWQGKKTKKDCIDFDVRQLRNRSLLLLFRWLIRWNLTFSRPGLGSDLVFCCHNI